jgi:hypothetical protein
MQENEKILNRQQIINDLSSFGIHDKAVYLIDIIPLIEMIWADGKAQKGEIALLEEFLKKHVAHINELAGCEVLTYDFAREFAMKLLVSRPDPALLKMLRSYIEPVRLAGSDREQSKIFKDSLLAACLEIAASSVVKYPYGIHDRFNDKEKKCFFCILDSLDKD